MTALSRKVLTQGLKEIGMQHALPKCITVDCLGSFTS